MKALRLLEDQDQARSGQITAFNKEVASRLASLDRGEYVEPGTARKWIDQKPRQGRKTRP